MARHHPIRVLPLVEYVRRSALTLALLAFLEGLVLIDPEGLSQRIAPLDGDIYFWSIWFFITSALLVWWGVRPRSRKAMALAGAFWTSAFLVRGGLIIWLGISDPSFGETATYSAGIVFTTCGYLSFQFFSLIHSRLDTA